MQLVIFGAKALALGMGTAVRELYPEYPLTCFLVSSLQENSTTLAGLPVYEINEFAHEITVDDRRNIHILICTPEDIHPKIVQLLEEYGFLNYTCMNSEREARLMEQYFKKKGNFKSLHALAPGKLNANIQVYSAKFYRDKKLDNFYRQPSWVRALQVGTELTDERVAEYTDNTGDNISIKNVNYCELTALYWLWKNRLLKDNSEQNIEYYGLFHYRRILEISDDDLKRMKENDVDAILQFPTLHEPDISEHHARYMKEDDWNAMLQALEELQPDYAKSFSDIFTQTYFYNYNLIIAKRQVLADYCAWLFPILERTEELSSPKGWERADRYIGYIGENLMTLYFLHNQKNLKIFHTGRLMLT